MAKKKTKPAVHERPAFIRHWTEIERLEPFLHPHTREPMVRPAPFAMVFELRRLAIRHDTIMPGWRSSQPHAERDEEELIFVLEGTPGARTADIDAGVDPRVTSVRSLVHFGRTARLGFPDGAAPRDPSDPYRKLERLDDPIRFNRSDIASFSPLDGATPGSVYVTDGEHHLYAVRLNNRTSRVHLLRWNRAELRWE